MNQRPTYFLQSKTVKLWFSAFGIGSARTHGEGIGGAVNSVPNGDRHGSPVNKVLRHKVTVVRSMTRHSGQVDLVEMVDYAVHGVKHWAVRIVLSAAVLQEQNRQCNAMNV